LIAQAGQIPARSGQRRNEAETDRIGAPGKDDRDRLRCGLGRACSRRADGEDGIRLKTNQFVGEA